MMRRSRSPRFAWLSSLFLIVLVAAPTAGLAQPLPAPAATITVNTNVDGLNDGDGYCSLREAITAANTNAPVDACPAGSGADIIAFNIGTGVVTITLGSNLPAISSPVFLDGTTQPGYSGRPLVRIDYTTRSLLLSGATNSTVRALDLSYYHGGTTGTGVAIVASTNVTVTNILAANRNGGIDVNGTSDVRILGNDLRYAGFGGVGAIRMYSIPANILPGGVLITGNRFGNSQYGLNLDIMSDLIISDGSLPGSNIVLSDTCGLTRTSSTAMIVSRLTDSTIAGVDLSYGGGGNGTRGLDIYNSTNLTVTEVTVNHRNTGIAVSGGQDVRILGNDLQYAGFGGGYALNVSNVAAGSLPRGVLITGNLFGNSQYGVRLSGLADQRISDGSIPGSNVVLADPDGLNQASTTALYLDNLSDSTAAGLDLAYTGGGNGTWGFYVNDCDNMTLTNILVAQRNWGIFVYGGSDIRLQDSDLHASGFGATYALVVWNVVANNLPGGVFISGNLFGDSENGIEFMAMSDLVVSDGSRPGSNVVIPAGSGLTGVSNTPLYLRTVTNATVDGVDLSYTGGGNGGYGLNAESSTNLTVTRIVAVNRSSGVSVNGGSDVRILGNDLRGAGYGGSYGLFIHNVAPGSLPSGVFVSGNRYGDSNNGVHLSDMDDVTIADSNRPGADVVISDTSGLSRADWTALYLSNVPSVTIDNLDLSCATGGFCSYGLRADTGTRLTLTGVNVQLRTWGLDIRSYATVRADCTSVRGNSVGMYIQSTTGDTVLWNNWFQGNGITALRNGTTPLITAENNYWGAPDGPSNLGGSGDSYQGNVDADPFLTAPADCVPSTADLAITKTVQPAGAAPGDAVAYTLVLANHGPEAAVGVVLTDIVPLEVLVQDVTYSGVIITDTGATPPYVWEVQDLAPGQAGVITLSGVLADCLPAGLVFTNTATIAGAVIDPAPGNNASAAPLTVLNVAPVASDDTYTTGRDTPLHVPAPGVLENDADANCEPLAAGLVTGVATGTLALGANGSFDYTPAAGWVGLVTFTYVASDGLAVSNVATVTINVTSTCNHGVVVVPASAAGAGAPGSAVVYTLRVTNTSYCSDTMDVAVSGNTWPTDAPPSVGPLAPGAGAAVAVTVSVPSGAGCGDGDTATVTFTSQGDGIAADSSVLTTTAGSFGALVTPAAETRWGDPGATVTHTLRLTNTGLCTDTFDAAVGGNLWPTMAPAVVGPLAPGAGSDIAVTVDIPGGASPGDFDVAVMTLTSRADGAVRAGSTLTTTVLGSCEPVTDTTLSWSPLTPTVGQPVTFTGSAQGTLPITYTWEFSDGGTGSGAVVVHTFAAAGTYAVTLTAANGCGSDWQQDTVVVEEVPPEMWGLYLPLVYKVQAP